MTVARELLDMSLSFHELDGATQLRVRHDMRKKMIQELIDAGSCLSMSRRVQIIMETVLHSRYMEDGSVVELASTTPADSP